MTTMQRETMIDLDPVLPTIGVTREFDAPCEQVFRAHADGEMFARWAGPQGLECRVDEWDAVTGGSYRYSMLQHGDPVASFFGSFHEVRENERLVETFAWEGMPDRVLLETLVFTDLGDGRTRLTSNCVLENMEHRDGMVSNDMESGIVEGYEKLDAVLAEG